MRKSDVLSLEKGAVIPDNSTLDVRCGECGYPMELRPSRYGMFWGCTRFPACRGTHGAHPDGRPLGTPANTETKKLRIAAHEVFDATWKNGQRSRTSAYRWLAKKIKLTFADCHIGSMDADQCRRVIGYCTTRLQRTSGATCTQEKMDEAKAVVRVAKGKR